MKLIKFLCLGMLAFVGKNAISQEVNLTDDVSKEWCYLKKSTTAIGMPYNPDVTEVTYDGSLYTGYAELCFGYGKNNEPIMTRQKVFKEGWIPVVEDNWSADGIRYYIEIFSSPLKDDDASNCVNFVKVKMVNENKDENKAYFSVATRGKLDDYRLAALKNFSPDNRYELKDNALYKDGNIIFTLDSGYKSISAIDGKPYTRPFTGSEYGVSEDTKTAIVAYEYLLKKGESKELVFKMPRVPSGDISFNNSLFEANYTTHLNKTVDYWKKIVDTDTRFEIPEKRINDAQKASLVHLLLATRTKDGNHKTQTDGIPYPNFFLTSAPQMVMAYLTNGNYEDAKLNVYNSIAQQEPDGLFFDKSLAHGGIIPAAHGHILFMTANYYLFTRDKETAKDIFPSIEKAIEYLKRETAANQYGLMPPTYPYDNEMIDGHYACNNYWALLGLRLSIRMAEDLGYDKVAKEWRNFEKIYLNNIIKGIEASVKEDGYVPPGLYPYLTGKQARRGFEKYQTESDWENMLLSYPTEILPESHKYVKGSLNHIRKGYAEGIMTYRHGMHLHQYITANLIEQYMVRGEAKQALIDFYHLILHSGSTHEGFENLVIPWKDRMVNSECPPPHAWASAKTAFLIRNFLVHEYGGNAGLEKGRNLYLYSVISPEWSKVGEHISIINAPTEMGVVNSTMNFNKGGAKVSFKALFNEEPTNICIKIPYFKTLKSFKSDAKVSKVENGYIILSPDFSYVDIKWSDTPEIHKGTTSELLKAYRECSSYEGVDENGVEILKEGKPFLLDSEKSNNIEPLSFDLIKNTFMYEFDRRTKSNR